MGRECIPYMSYSQLVTKPQVSLKQDRQQYPPCKQSYEIYPVECARYIQSSEWPDFTYTLIRGKPIVGIVTPYAYSPLGFSTVKKR